MNVLKILISVFHANIHMISCSCLTLVSHFLFLAPLLSDLIWDVFKHFSLLNYSLLVLTLTFTLVEYWRFMRVQGMEDFP